MLCVCLTINQTLVSTCRVEAALQHWYVTGLQQQGAVPSLIASVGDSLSSLLSIVFELNPAETFADQLLRVHSQPIEIIYDAVTRCDHKSHDPRLSQMFPRAKNQSKTFFSCSWRWTVWLISLRLGKVSIWRFWPQPRCPNWKRSKRKLPQVSFVQMNN